MPRKKAPATQATKKRRTTKKANKPKRAASSSAPRKADTVRPLTTGWSFPVPWPSGDHRAVFDLTVYPDVVRHVLTQRLAQLYRSPKDGKDDPLSALRAKLNAMEDRGAAHTAATLEAAIDLLPMYMGLVHEAVELFLTLAALHGSHVAMFGPASARGRDVSIGLRSVGQAAIVDFAEYYKKRFLFTTKRGPKTKTDRDVELLHLYERYLKLLQDDGWQIKAAKTRATILACGMLNRQFDGDGFAKALGRARIAERGKEYGHTAATIGRRNAR
jgi:hypothetical protein